MKCVDIGFRLEELRGLIGDLTNALQMQIATDKGTKRKRSENDADAAKMEALQQVHNSCC